MTSLILQFLPLAAAAIAPVMVMAVILLLSANKGFGKGLAFIIGRTICYSILAIVFLFIIQNIDRSSGGPSSVILYVKIGLGLLLLGLALKNIIVKKDAGVQTPKWMASLDKAKPAALLGIGFGLSLIQIRYVALLLAGTAFISETGLPAGQLIFAVTILIICLIWAQVLPLTIYLVMGKNARKMLAGLKKWLIQNQKWVNFTVLLLFGCILLWKGISGLLT